MLHETKRFHNKVKLKKVTDDPEGPVPITYTKVFYKEYPRLPYIVLPEIDYNDSQFETLLEMRESSRLFSDEPVKLKELSKVLRSCRIVDPSRDPERRTYPSGGARFPVELYLLAYNVDGLEGGAYHYNIKKEGLELLLRQDLRDIRRELISPYLENPAATIVFTSVIARSEVKYGHKGYTYSFIEAGHIGQNIHLACTEIGIGSCSVSGF
ncbi:MAG: SagB/ThcOx family dehydrogenase, partial [Candidatus Aenigmarchaeota archaeon]|nr:SagB/ThcOx family dehydrogenase [Candidatus Aenigmarchaeota archaeon]